MSTKTLDRHTKAELIALLNAAQDEAHALRGRLETLNFDHNCLRETAENVATTLKDEILALREQLTALESRRRHETQSYRARLRGRGPAANMDLSAAAKAYCAAHGVKSCTKAQAVQFASSARS